MRRVGDRRRRRAPTLCATRWSAAARRGSIPLAGATYPGGRPTSAARKGSAAMLGLTDRRVIFLPIAGERLSVPRARIAGARLEERRRDAGAPPRQPPRATAGASS